MGSTFGILMQGMVSCLPFNIFFQVSCTISNTLFRMYGDSKETGDLSLFAHFEIFLSNKNIANKLKGILNFRDMFLPISVYLPSKSIHKISVVRSSRCWSNFQKYDLSLLL